MAAAEVSVDCDDDEPPCRPSEPMIMRTSRTPSPIKSSRPIRRFGLLLLAVATFGSDVPQSLQVARSVLFIRWQFGHSPGCNGFGSSDAAAAYPACPAWSTAAPQLGQKRIPSLTVAWH